MKFIFEYVQLYGTPPVKKTLHALQLFPSQKEKSNWVLFLMLLYNVILWLISLDPDLCIEKCITKVKRPKKWLLIHFRFAQCFPHISQGPVCFGMFCRMQAEGSIPSSNTGCGFYCERGCHHPSLVLHLLESKSSVYISLDRVMMVTLPAVELRAEPCQTFARVIHQPASSQLPTDNFLFL